MMKYIETEKTLSEKINSLPAGAKLPTFQELKAEMEISQSTLDRALRSLQEKGVIFKRRGSGIFVSQNSANKSRTFNIGVLVSDITNRFCALLIRGIEAELSKRGYRMILCNGASELNKEIGIIFSMKEKIDALIVFPTTPNVLNPEYAKSLTELEKRTGIPFVFVDIAVSGMKGNFVGFDQYGAFFETAMRIIPKLPERQIIYIGQAGSIIGTERFLGFKDALINLNVSTEKVKIFYFDEKFRDSFRQLIKQVKQSHAVVFAANPDLLMDFVNVARKENIRIPEDIIIAGVVEEDYLNYLDTPIISLKKPSIDMGIKAAQTVLEILSGRGETQTCRLKLIIEAHDKLKKLVF